MPLVGPFILVVGLACTASSVAVALLCKRYRSVHGARLYSAVAWAGALWGASQTLRMVTTGLASKLVIANAQFVLLQAWAYLLATFTIGFAWPTVRRAWVAGIVLAAPAVITNLVMI